MRIQYDPAVDALTIRFVEERVECETIHLNDQVAVEVGRSVFVGYARRS